MKQFLYSLFALLLISTISFGQTFENNDDYNVPEDNNFHYYPITVSGVGIISENHGLEKVCVFIEDNDDGDLAIYLESPDGTMVELSTYNGGDEDDYGSSGWGGSQTCFTMAASTNITDGTATFEGDFIPEGDMSLVNNFQNADGAWKLCLKDTNGSNNSDITLNKWSLVFSDTVPASITRITTCDADFYDLDSTNNYSPDEYHVWVICPNDTNKNVGFNFSVWDVEQGNDDYLMIWDDTTAMGGPMDRGHGN